MLEGRSVFGFPLRHFTYISNILSLIRILLVIPIIILLRTNTTTGNIFLIGLTFIAILTDYFDGFLSRRLNQITDLGKVLDPLADKITMAIIVVALIIYRGFPVSLAALLIFRDITILAFGLLVIKKGHIPSSIFLGKLNSFFLSFLGFFYIINCRNELVTIFYFASYVTIIASGIAYYFKKEKVLVLNLLPRMLARMGALVFLVFLIISVTAISHWQLGGENETLAYEKEWRHSDESDLIKAFAPTFYFSRHDSLQPTDAQSYLTRSKLMRRSIYSVYGKETDATGDVARDLSNFNSNRYYLKQINGSQNTGMTAPEDPAKQMVIYSAVFRVEMDNGRVSYIIHYWLFYSSGRSGPFNLFKHRGRWQLVAFYLDHNQKPLWTGFSQGSHFQVHPWESLEMENDHPVVYISQHRHNSYFRPGLISAYYDWKQMMPIARDICQKTVQRTPADYTILPLSPELTWIDFKGYWGPPVPRRNPGPRYFYSYHPNFTFWDHPVEWFQNALKEQ